MKDCKKRVLANVIILFEKKKINKFNKIIPQLYF
jgi:hypothetical protein